MSFISPLALSVNKMKSCCLKEGCDYSFVDCVTSAFQLRTPRKTLASSTSSFCQLGLFSLVDFLSDLTGPSILAKWSVHLSLGQLQVCPSTSQLSPSNTPPYIHLTKVLPFIDLNDVLNT